MAPEGADRPSRRQTQTVDSHKQLAERSSEMKSAVAFFSLIALVCTPGVLAEDWPQYLGPTEIAYPPERYPAFLA